MHLGASCDAAAPSLIRCWCDVNRFNYLIAPATDRYCAPRTVCVCAWVRACVCMSAFVVFDRSRYWSLLCSQDWVRVCAWVRACVCTRVCAWVRACVCMSACVCHECVRVLYLIAPATDRYCAHRTGYACVHECVRVCYECVRVLYLIAPATDRYCAHRTGYVCVNECVRVCALILHTHCINISSFLKLRGSIVELSFTSSSSAYVDENYWRASEQGMTILI